MFKDSEGQCAWVRVVGDRSREGGGCDLNVGVRKPLGASSRAVPSSAISLFGGLSPFAPLPCLSQVCVPFLPCSEGMGSSPLGASMDLS